MAGAASSSSRARSRSRPRADGYVRSAYDETPRRCEHEALLRRTRVPNTSSSHPLPRPRRLRGDKSASLSIESIAASAGCAGTTRGPRGQTKSVERHLTNLVSSSSRQSRAAPPSHVAAGVAAIVSGGAVISLDNVIASALSPRRRASNSFLGSKVAPRPTCQSARASFRIKATTGLPPICCVRFGHRERRDRRDVNTRVGTT